MKAQEFRDMSEAELQARATELVDELFHLRLKRATSELPNPMKVRQTRRDLARVKTILAERARDVAPAERAAAPAPRAADAPAPAAPAEPAPSAEAPKAKPATRARAGKPKPKPGAGRPSRDGTKRKSR
ncbi:MAG TPA: 50S ribosomal protein L29 [Candidatus Binatia bacterium]|nr:50S ribosomal protein L29 [Candidatus Binatia bacterium]